MENENNDRYKINELKKEADKKLNEALKKYTSFVSVEEINFFFENNDDDE